MDPSISQTDSRSRNEQSIVSQDFIDPVQQLRHLWRFKWQVSGFVLLAAIVGLFMAYSVTPKYRGTATMLLEPKGANVVKIDEVYQSDNPTNEYRKTQYEVLASRKLALRVVNTVDLTRYPEFAPPEEETPSRLDAIITNAKDLLIRYGVKTENESTAQSNKTQGVPEQRLASQLLRKIRIEPVLNTHLVKIHVEAHDPKLSAFLANLIADTYIQSEIESRLGITDQASGWLTSRLTELKAELEKSESELQKFYESQQLVSMGGARGILEEELRDNSRRLREARKIKTELQNVYRKIVDSGNNLELMQEIPDIQQDPLVQSTKRSFLEAGASVSELKSRYGKKHPKMIAAQARLDEAKDAYFRQLRLATDGIKSQYEIARNTEQSLATIVDKSKGQIQNLDSKQYRLEMLQREVESNRELFETFLKRFKETDIASNLATSNARVIDPAIVPQRPYKPRKKLWLATFVLIGLLIGSALAMVRGYLDDRISDSSDLERVAGLPVLSVLPIVKNLHQKTNKKLPVEIEAPNSVFAEGVRTVRTSLQIADNSAKRKKIMITSSVPAEGKSSVAENLAAAFGQMERVLLVEGDLRKPSLAKYLNLPTDIVGIEDALTGTSPLEECIHSIPGSRIDVLPCSKAPKNPSELLGSAAFISMLETVNQDYDRIIIDSPPCQAVSDALVIGRHVDTVVFLVKADSTHSRLVANSLKQLRYANLPLLGAILNQANMKKKGKYGTGYYYYQDYYKSSSSA